MAMWSPWRGCHKCSEGCKYCYIHKGDARKNIDTSIINKTDKFDYPIRKNKDGTYKMKSDKICYVCFSSDFLIEEADPWREECFSMIKERSDVTFLFLTKRIERFMDCIPDDWKDGYDNVVVGVSVENQENVNKKIGILQSLPIKHKMIILQPLLEEVNLEKYLDNIELVMVGGESDKFARPLNYDWVLNIREQCMKHKIPFEFHQAGTNFIKDGIQYKINPFQLTKQARLANIDYLTENRKR